MRNIYRIALVSVLAFSLVAAPTELFAQARRSTTTTTSNSSSSDNKSATTASRSTASRSTTTAPSTTASRSAGTTASRQTSSTTNRQTTTAPAAGSGSSSQVRRSTTSTSGSNSTASRSTASRSTTTTPSTTAKRQTSAAQTTPSRQVTAARSSGTSAQTAPQSGTPSRIVRSNNTSASKGLTSAPSAEAQKVDVKRSGQASNKAAGENLRDLNYAGGRGQGHMHMDDNRNLNRIPPRERDVVVYNMPGSFYGPAPHFFGYRVTSLPPRYRRISHWGIDYYYYDNVYYRRYGTYYVVVRPPFGVALDIAIADAAFASVRFSYYHNVYHTYDVIDSNYRTIMEQNRTIAQNNAILAQQNSALALNSARATTADEIARALGLVQSYADINTEYYYQDGVFYVVNNRNRYEVIVPPAGALVSELPDDYDILVLNGVEYYKVDDTVYRLVLVDGTPALEVLGQMYGSMAQKYNYYN